MKESTGLFQTELCRSCLDRPIDCVDRRGRGAYEASMETTDPHEVMHLLWPDGAPEQEQAYWDMLSQRQREKASMKIIALDRLNKGMMPPADAVALSGLRRVRSMTCARNGAMNRRFAHSFLRSVAEGRRRSSDRGRSMLQPAARSVQFPIPYSTRSGRSWRSMHRSRMRRSGADWLTPEYRNNALLGLCSDSGAHGGYCRIIWRSIMAGSY